MLSLTIFTVLAWTAPKMLKSCKDGTIINGLLHSSGPSIMCNANGTILLFVSRYRIYEPLTGSIIHKALTVNGFEAHNGARRGTAQRKGFKAKLRFFLCLRWEGGGSGLFSSRLMPLAISLVNGRGSLKHWSFKLFGRPIHRCSERVVFFPPQKSWRNHKSRIYDGMDELSRPRAAQAAVIIPCRNLPCNHTCESYCSHCRVALIKEAYRYNKNEIMWPKEITLVARVPQDIV